MMLGGKRRKIGGDEGEGDDTAASTSKSCRHSKGEEGLDSEKVHSPGPKEDNNDSDHGHGGDGRNSNEGEAEAMELCPLALLNEVVLRNLFKYLSTDLELLGHSRLVCLTWRDTSLPIWRSIATPKIVFSRSRSAYFLIDADKVKTRLHLFLDFLEGEEGQAVPYRQFHLKRWMLHPDGMGGTDTNRFWEQAGRHLTKLTLESCKTARSEDFLRLINQTCPNLEVLILDMSIFSGRELWEMKLAVGDGTDSTYPIHGEHLKLKTLHLLYKDCRLSNSLRIPYLELLSHFPNLTLVKIESNGLRREITNFLKAVKKIRGQNPSKLPITQLATGDPVNFKFQSVRPPLANGEEDPEGHRVDELMSLLQELRITLQSIILTANLKPDEIHNVVEFNGSTLTTITAWAPRCNFPFGVELPALQQLKMTERFCTTFEFIKYTPNLIKLCIWDDCRGLLEILRDAPPLATTLVSAAPKSELVNTKLLKLTILRLEDIAMTEEDLKCLVKWMPRVKNLKMILNDEQFGIVCENWQGLVELRVRGSDLSDEGVTGMKFHLQSGGGTLDLDQATRPNVTCLQNLEVFEALDSTLTDVSLFHGLLRIGRLRRLFFKNYDGIVAEAKEAVEQLGIRACQFDIEDRIY